MSVDLDGAGSGLIPGEKTPRCWAGGHHWSTGSKLAEFLAESGWWHGFTPGDTLPASVQTRELFPQIQIGDYFAIKGSNQQGLVKIWFAGTVTEIDTEAQRLKLASVPLPEKSTIKPRKGTQSLSGTLREVTDPALIDWMFHQQPYPGETKGLPMPETDDTLPAKNTILYGPPGTGKTYNTILQAVGIIDGAAPETLSMDEAKPRWDVLRSEGRIEFVTFHQSYGYEDFVEGIRPVMTDEAGETPRYEVFEGVLKRIALRALLDALKLVPEQIEAPRHSTFDQVWTALKDDITAAPDKEYSGATTATKFRLQVSDIGNIQMENILNPDTKKQTIGREKAAEIWELHTESKEEQVDALLSSGNYPARKIVFERLKQLDVADKQEVEHPASVSIDAARDYLRKGSQTGYQLNTANPPRYVLVIDEINRGNISKIFGELITLIEDDKRIGGEVGLTVTLPHSRETFGIPANLYILGTMNTADKSIALVDVALRRRFEFEEMLPRFTDETCPGMTGEMRAAIVRLNERIVLRKDRDHQIGHAFFRAVASTDDFNRVFAKKIIPLLQEYFYGDWESLRYVLGETGDSDKDTGFIVPLPDGNVPGARNRWQWYRDSGKSLDPLHTLVQNYK